MFIFGGSWGRLIFFKRFNDLVLMRGRGGSVGGGGEFGNGELNILLENFEVKIMMRREVYGFYDVLDLLYKVVMDKLVF